MSLWHCGMFIFRNWLTVFKSINLFISSMNAHQDLAPSTDWPQLRSDTYVINFNGARNYRVSRKTTHYVVRGMCSYLIDILQCSYIQALELYLFSRLRIYLDLYQYFYFLAVNIFLDSISVTNGQHPWDDSGASAWRWYPCLNFCWMTEPRSIYMYSTTPHTYYIRTKKSIFLSSGCQAWLKNQNCPLFETIGWAYIHVCICVGDSLSEVLFLVYYFTLQLTSFHKLCVRHHEDAPFCSSL